MNKKFKYGRAFAINSDDSLPVITDTEKDKDYFKMFDIVYVLNEQQATIQSLKEENEQLKKARDESDKFIVKKGLEIEFFEWCMK